MKDYRTYRPEDFAEDLSFRRWVLESDEEDYLFWTNWIVANPDKEVYINSARKMVLSIIKAYDNISDAEIAEELARLDERIEQKEQKVWHRMLWFMQHRGLQVAAVLLAFWGLWVWLKNDNDSSLGTYEDLTNLIVSDERLEQVNNTNKLMVVTLSDGSSIVLEKGSRLSYPRHFKNGKREVVLSGEAFFEIAKDPTMPFYVYTNRLVTKVLGTSFTIHEDTQNHHIRVVVKTGRVSVFARTEDNIAQQHSTNKLIGLVLTPNQQVTFNENDLQLVRTLVETPEVVQLPIQQQQFNFDRTPISEVFTSLEKFYGLKIIYDAEVMKNCYLTASLDDEPLFEKLNLICKTIDARYEQIDAQLIIYSRGCN
ncbi:MAG: FecR family protein [Spirosomataceae bacterium]